MTDRSDLFDVDATLIMRKGKGMLLDDGSTREWVPESLVEDNGDGTFTMPEWLAIEKGFV